MKSILLKFRSNVKDINIVWKSKDKKSSMRKCVHLLYARPDVFVFHFPRNMSDIAFEKQITHFVDDNARNKVSVTDVHRNDNTLPSEQALVSLRKLQGPFAKY